MTHKKSGKCAYNFPLGVKEMVMASGFITKAPQSHREKAIIFKCIKNFLGKNDIEDIFENEESEKSQPANLERRDTLDDCNLNFYFYF